MCIKIRELAVAPHTYAFPDLVLPIAASYPHDWDSAANRLRAVVFHGRAVSDPMKLLGDGSQKLDRSYSVNLELRIVDRFEKERIDVLLEKEAEPVLRGL